MRPARRTAATISLASLSIAAMLSLTSCASANQSSTGSSTSGAGKTVSKSLTDAALAAAKQAAGNKKIGGSLTILGVTSGDEAKELTAAMKPFEDATGITIKYTGTQDQATVLAAAVKANNPPDIVDGQGIGLMKQYAEAGKATALDFIPTSTFSNDFSKPLVDSATVNGKVYGIWGETDTFQVWYNTATYKGPKTGSWQDLTAWAATEAKKNHGDAPWCMAINAGAGSGFPAQSWIENVFLKKYGPEKYAQWANGQLSWTSPEVKWAWQQFGDVATSKTMVEGGPQAVVSSSFLNYSKGMFSKPQTCQLTLWGNYAAGLAQSIYPNVKVPADMDFFPVPASDSQYANAIGTQGHVTFAMKNTAAVQAFMKYWESSAAQSVIASGGSWTMGNKNVALTNYPNPAIRSSAKLLQSTSDVVPGPAAVASSAVNTAFNKGIVAYIQSPSSLDSILSGIEAASK